MKLKDWAEKTGIKYLTAYRWFKAGDIPGAYQTGSGTILVPDDSLEQNMAINNSSDAMSFFLKKTVEFSKNNSSVEDFAAFVISNFQLKLNGVSEGPKYSKNKPKTEEIQKHFQKFIPDQKDIEHLKTVKSLIKEGKASDNNVVTVSADDTAKLFTTDDMQNLFNDVENSTTDTHVYTDVHMYGELSTEGLVKQSVDFNTTPQQINYTGSTSQAFGSSSIMADNNWEVTPTFSADIGTLANLANSPFQPTQKELLSASKIKTAENVEMPRKRGRKPFKKGNNV